MAVAVSGHEQGQTQEAYAVEPAPHGRQWCGREGGIGGHGPVSPEDIARWCCGAAGATLRASTAVSDGRQRRGGRQRRPGGGDAAACNEGRGAARVGGALRPCGACEACGLVRRKARDLSRLVVPHILHFTKDSMLHTHLSLLPYIKRDASVQGAHTQGLILTAAPSALHFRTCTLHLCTSAPLHLCTRRPMHASSATPAPQRVLRHAWD